VSRFLHDKLRKLFILLAYSSAVRFSQAAYVYRLPSFSLLEQTKEAATWIASSKHLEQVGIFDTGHTIERISDFSLFARVQADIDYRLNRQT